MKISTVVNVCKNQRGEESKLNIVNQHILSNKEEKRYKLQKEQPQV
jgi:hypothetical protein